MVAEFTVKAPAKGTYKLVTSDGYEQVIDPEKGYSGTIYPGTFVTISGIDDDNQLDGGGVTVTP